ncbi:MAG: DNA repair protein RadC [Acidobacteriota bacterium]
MQELPPASRPREKLLARGAGALADSDLLALLLGGGTRKESAIRMAGRLVRRRSLTDLAQRPARSWMRERGIGLARGARLVAAFELGRRAGSRALEAPPRITSPAEAFRLIRDLGRVRKEHLVGLYLDGQNGLLARETLSIGSLNTTRTHPREILEPALRRLALGFILAHNHPSGSLVPSIQDTEFTRGVARAAAIMDIGFYDHLIVSSRGYVSLRERGLMEECDGPW